MKIDITIRDTTDEDILDLLAGQKFRALLQDLDNELRAVTKHDARFGDMSYSKELDHICETVRERIYEMTRERDLNLWS